MPLPVRRHSLSVMDAYCHDEDDMGHGAARGTVPQEVPLACPYPPHMHPGYLAGAAAVCDAASSGGTSRQTSRTASSSASRLTAYSTDSTFTSGYFLNDQRRNKTSPSACFAQKTAATRPVPPGVLALREQRRLETTPGPGKYSPLYSMQARPSPYA
eukprot:TRINITY_DN24978_c0_g1_i1.p2 TRINITY_DN24978_c0_g1~~TRINITY_DN24978_c0_g1_i1.p2  ORF type:complete len:157 (+),score=43.09 TRINITY_DN24978_c0_g1_i1:54-524(+)